MENTGKYVFVRGKRPKTRAEVMQRRFLHARASLEIEGLVLTKDEVAVFEECIQKECSLTERTALLRKYFPGYDNAIHA